MKCKNHKYKIVYSHKNWLDKYAIYLQCKCGNKVILRFLKEECEKALSELWLQDLIQASEIEKLGGNIYTLLRNKYGDL